MKEILSNVRGRKLLNDLWSVSHFPWISHFLTICYMYTDYRQYRWYRQCDLPDPPTYQPESLTIPIREVHSIYAPKIQALPERGVLPLARIFLEDLSTMPWGPSKVIIYHPKVIISPQKCVLIPQNRSFYHISLSKMNYALLSKNVVGSNFSSRSTSVHLQYLRLPLFTSTSFNEPSSGLP